MYRHSLFFALPATLLLCAASGEAQLSTVNVQVSDQINTSAGVNGRLQVAMSTNLQLVNYSADFFSQNPQALATLGALQPQHTRIQLVPGSDPLTSPDVWNFSQIDPLLTARSELRRPQPRVSNCRRACLHGRFERRSAPGQL